MAYGAIALVVGVSGCVHSAYRAGTATSAQPVLLRVGYGGCPWITRTPCKAYELEVHADGVVLFDGKSGVKRLGKYSDVRPAADVEAFVATLCGRAQPMAKGAPQRQIFDAATVRLSLPHCGDGVFLEFQPEAKPEAQMRLLADVEHQFDV